MSAAVPPAVLATLPPQLQEVADAAQGRGAHTAVTHARVTCSEKGAPRPHYGQRWDWAERAQALSALPVPSLEDDWRTWPQALQGLVREMWSRGAFTEECLEQVALRCAGDEDLDDCLRLMREGVPLADPNHYPPHFHPPNSPSTRMAQTRAGLRATLQKEIAAGRILPLPRGWESFWVHALAAVMKPNGSIREIHNHKGYLNDAQSYAHTRIATLDDICNGFREGMLLAVLDISVYYRHWMVRPQDWLLQAFEYDVYGTGVGLWMDVHMEFGTKNSPEVANRAAAMFRRSFTRWLVAEGAGDLAFVVVNTDDWLLLAQARVAHRLFAALQEFLRAMGLVCNDDKQRQPAGEQVYTGWIIDAQRQCVRLTPEKIAKAELRAREILETRGPVLDTAWEKLHGYLTHITGVVAWGSMWLQGIRRCMAAARASGSAACSPAAAAELRWWIANVRTFDGHLRLMGSRLPVPREGFCLSTDATGTGDVGIFVHGRALWCTARTTAAYFAGTFDTAAAAGDAQVWELAAFVMLVERFGADLVSEGHRALRWHTDSSSAKGAINRMAHRNAQCLALLRRLYAVLHSLGLIVVEAVHIAGELNVLPDALSRWHEPGKQHAFWAAASEWSRAHGNMEVRVQEWSG
jgi:hypothetical protein